jgi:hypothetical protein
MGAMGVWTWQGVEYTIPEAGGQGHFPYRTRYRIMLDGAVESLRLCPQGDSSMRKSLQEVVRQCYIVLSRLEASVPLPPFLPGMDE